MSADLEGAGDPGVVVLGDEEADATVRELLPVAEAGLVSMFDPVSGRFCHTMRGVATPAGPQLRREGVDLLYDAIAALGLHRLPEARQRVVLGGTSAGEFALRTADRALTSADLGGVALAAWASAEVAGVPRPDLLSRLEVALARGSLDKTVEVAWALTAGLASAPAGDGSAVVAAARQTLMSAQGADGLFPRNAPSTHGPAWRRHVGCFADQVYPILALARLHASRTDGVALDAARRCAEQLCSVQGASGQWWWHYDHRNGRVVERFPVYSVHQHAMAPMALLELESAGGGSYRAQVALGLQWLHRHPEVLPELIHPAGPVVWRKVGRRRERRKLVRALAAAGTAMFPGLTLPAVDRLFPATFLDLECRPYELGWLIYAWRSSGVTGANR